MIGVACAYELVRAGAEVIVLDAGRTGGGASQGNTGWVTPSFAYPLAAPGVVRQGMRSALDPDGALVMRPALDPSYVRWLWRFRANCTTARFREATRALAALNARTLELLDAYQRDGVRFEMHADGLVVAARTEAGLEVYRQLFRELREAGHDAHLDELDADTLVLTEPALDRADRGVRPALPRRSLRAAGVARGRAREARHRARRRDPRGHRGRRRRAHRPPSGGGR